VEILNQFRGILGVVLLLAIAWAFSNNRRKIPWRVIAWGMVMQLGFALLILKTTVGKSSFDLVRQVATQLIAFSGDGASFLFGVLGTPGKQLQMLDAMSNEPISFGFSVAFQVLPVIIFFSSLMAVLYHFGIMQKVVAGFAWIMRRSMKISGAESLAVAANIFVGNVESPLAIRPYLKDMTISELATVMTAGFATVAGSVMAAYIGFGVDAGHLIAASVMSAPAAVVVAKLLYPETETPATMGGAKVHVDKETVNVIDAAASGAAAGLKIAAMVGAMLIAFISLIAMVNFILGFVHTSLGEIFGYIFSPIAWCMGVDTADMRAVGNLLGTKVAINEFVAYLNLVGIKEQISERSFIISTYALCGFANFGSIAIAIGGIGGIAPERRADLARLGFKTMMGGAIASWLTASIAGMMV
jgi:concentrative nucleoside transporter, CNT family